MSPRTKEQFEQMKETARADILSAALALFAHNGLHATGVTDIAKAAGVSTGLLYHYFPSKEAVFTELIRNAVSSSATAMTTYRDGHGSAKEKIIALSRALIAVLADGTEMANYFTLLMQAGLAGGGQPEESLADMRESLNAFRMLTGIIERGQGDGTVRAGDAFELTTVYWAAFQGLCLYRLMMRELFVLPSAECLSGILLNERQGA